MPISLTCTCGARLEIDDKFAGQTISCPDCSKPLLAEPAAPPAPEPTSTSGLAVLSLLLALVGAFTIVGTLAAIACGAVAYRRVTKRGSHVGGARLAQAGMILGAAFTVISVGTYASRSLLGLDGVLRQYLWGGKLEFLGPMTVSKKPGFDDSFSIDRPSPAWGVLKSQPNQKEHDLLMLVNPREDAHILWLWDSVDADDDDASKRARAVTVFRGSEFVRLLGRVPDLESESFKQRGINEIGGGAQEFFLDITLGGIPRTFLIRLEHLPRRSYVNVLIAGARAHRFEQLLPILRRAATVKQEVN